MTARELSIAGAWEITPVLRTDSRGLFFEWFTEAGFAEFAGHQFDVRQANCSVSTRGVLRGVHFAQVPPSQAKYVTCVHGAVYDVVVDIRVGSPTFGQWDAALLDDKDRRSIYISEGLGHAFLALEDNSTVMYLCSAPYAPQREHTVRPTDFGIEWPEVPELILSDRDAEAPSLAEAEAAGLLPKWEDCQAFVESLRRSLVT